MTTLVQQVTDPNPDTLRLVAELPKTETHLHIEGALPFALLQARFPEKFIEPPASWHPAFKYRDFGHFETELLDMAFAYYTSPERYYDAAKVIFQQHLQQNVRYVETSFASGIIEFAGLDGREVLAAILEAVPAELDVRVFMGIHHGGFGPKMRPVIEQACQWDGLAGFDLHGVESHPVEPCTETLWQRARDAGKVTKAHAGEFLGPEFIRYCVETLGVTYLQHGTRAVEDPELMTWLRQHKVTLDLCPISNIKLMPGMSWDKFPIRQFMEAGISVTISTDDPLCFGNTLTDDYLMLAEACHLSHEALRTLSQNGFLSRNQEPPTI